MVIYNLWAECENEAGLYKLKDHFSGFQHTFLTGRTLTFGAIILYEEICGLYVWSTQLCKNRTDIENLNDALEISEASIVLYHHLKSAPDFYFAHVGWNAEMTTSESLSESIEIEIDGFQSVISDAFYKQLGSPATFRQFREGYWWNKDEVETNLQLPDSDRRRLRDLSECLSPDD